MCVRPHAGLKVSAIYSDGTSTGLSADEYTITPADSVPYGLEALTIRYDGASVRQPVTVSNEQVPITEWMFTDIQVWDRAANSNVNLADPYRYPMTPAFDPSVKNYVITIPRANECQNVNFRFSLDNAFDENREYRLEYVDVKGIQQSVGSS